MSEASESSLARFRALVRDRPVPLGEGCLVIARHLGGSEPVADGLARLDELAAGVPGDDLDAVARFLFVEQGFHGNRSDYYDPANSLLPAVLRRRTGIPITLAAVVIEVARRRGIDAVGVGMPGHFLVGNGPRPTRWLDAFDDGTWVDEAGAAARFAAVHGDAGAFDRRFLDPTPDPLVLGRVLANLAGVYRAAGDARRLVRVLELRREIPGAGTGPRSLAELGEALATVGRVDEAARCYEELAARVEPAAAEAAERRAQVLRARFN